MKTNIAAVVLVAVLLPHRFTLAGVAEGGQPKQQHVGCVVRAILGAETGKGIDSRLKPLKKQLTKPPFATFKSLKLLTERRLRLVQGKVGQTTLPSGKVLKLTFKEKLLEQKNHVRLRMHLSIVPPKTKRFLPGTQFTIINGGTLLVAGDQYQGGTLIVGITCKG